MLQLGADFTPNLYIVSRIYRSWKNKLNDIIRKQADKSRCGNFSVTIELVLQDFNAFAVCYKEKRGWCHEKGVTEGT